jgi:membrane-bound metal-dependent hydrolase YbcI (DUF457 family)
MTGKTHLLIGINSLWFLAPIPGALTASSLALSAGAAAIGSLLPDLDASESTIKHAKIGSFEPMAVLANPIAKTTTHRGMLHSWIGIGLVVIISLPPIFLWGWVPSIALILGYGSHLLADSCTPSGITLKYPNLTKKHLLPQGARIQTGSQAENMIFMIAAASAGVLLLTQVFKYIQ